ncbi:MAG: glycerol-3-phosphate responsive antiterminator [Bacteroidaceae bacterium]|nr:glycerol-3-phosphate responsive antiterminator [Bacteroidaceae bacterium]
MNKLLREAIEDSPIITAIKDNEGLEKCLTCEESRTVFILYGDILNISSIVDRVKQAGKLAFVHIDLISGLQQKEIAVDFIKEHTAADGIISTKATLISKARELGLFTVMRFFVIDSMAYDNIARQLKSTHPDIIEVLPGPMPKVVKRICSMTKCPVIAGGLVSDKEDVYALLDAGAACISSTNTDVWTL